MLSISYYFLLYLIMSYFIAQYLNVSLADIRYLLLWCDACGIRHTAQCVWHEVPQCCVQELSTFFLWVLHTFACIMIKLIKSNPVPLYIKQHELDKTHMTLLAHLNVVYKKLNAFFLCVVYIFACIMIKSNPVLL